MDDVVRAAVQVHILVDLCLLGRQRGLDLVFLPALVSPLIIPLKDYRVDLKDHWHEYVDYHRFDQGIANSGVPARRVVIELALDYLV